MSDYFLSIENLLVNLGGCPVLQDINFWIRPNEQLAILGTSGSGKTVLAHTLAGRHIYQGSISGAFEDTASFQQQYLNMLCA